MEIELCIINYMQVFKNITYIGNNYIKHRRTFYLIMNEKESKMVEYKLDII